MTIATRHGAEAEEILSMVEEKFGFRPNLIQEMVAAPAAARMYLAAQDALADASLSDAQAQAVQLTVATHNGCDYCSGAHSALGRKSGISDEDLAAIREGGTPADAEIASVVRATRRVLEERGWLDESDLEELAADGIDRQKLFEIIGFVAVKTLSNYVNHIAGTELDPQLRQS